MDGRADRHRGVEASSGRVLVVDDDEVLRRELAAALEISGLRTLEAADADGALAALAVNADVVVVLTDIRMPGRSGIALAGDLLEAQRGQHAVEVVLMSGHAGLDEALGAVRSGAFDLLRKPFRLAECTSVIGRAMARAHERRRAALATEQSRLEREALWRAAPVGLGRIGPDLRLSGANPILSEMLGISDGADIASLWEREARLRDAIAPALERVLAGKLGDPPTCLSVSLAQAAQNESVAGPRELDLRLYPVPDGEDPCRVGAVGLACLDVTAVAALLRELEHRVKNAFAIFLGLVHGAARHAAGRDVATVTADLAGRVMALSRAHDLIRPAIGGVPAIAAAEGCTMRALAETVLAPVAGLSPDGRITLSGPTVTIAPTAAAGLALVLHELVTNALKHGALSTPAGRLDLAWTTCERGLELDWRETGGPPVAGPPTHTGFGLRLLGRSNASTPGLHTAFDWSRPAGLQAHIMVPLETA